jgi:imidazolonepropionase
VSLPVILALACARMQMSEAEAITAATINGAHAMGLARLAGSLEVGKQADLLMLHVADYRELPAYFGVNLVAMTMKRGRVLHREAEVEWRD